MFLGHKSKNQRPPSYIIWTPHSYCFRLRVPIDLQGIIGKTELRYSLKTGSLRDAKTKARLIAGQIQRLFKRLRRGEGSPYRTEQIHVLIVGYVEQAIHQHTGTVNRPLPDPKRLLMGGLHEQVVGLEAILMEIKQAIASGDHTKPALKAPTLKTIIDKYVKENLRAKKWSPRTIVSYRNYFKLMVEFTGDVPIETVTAKTMQDYKDLLTNLPANFFKSKRYKDTPLNRVKHMKTGDGGISVNTINSYLTAASALFDYAVRNQFMSHNPAKGLKLPRTARPDKQRDTFNHDDLHKIFHSKRYMDDTHFHPYCFWLPVLGLYTGCRIEELCQLHTGDVKRIDGLWVLDINDNGNDKRLKNAHSKRVVPLHPVLVDDLGFPAFAQTLHEKGMVRVFMELTKIQHCYSHAASKWFGRYRNQIGLNGAGKKTYHSFRHTFTDHLKQKQISPYLIDELTGHAIEGETMGRYGKRFPAKTLYEHGILHINYGIDLSHLRNSKYVTVNRS